MLIHTFLEQYMTVKLLLHQDRFTESILQTLQEIAPKNDGRRVDHDAAANFMELYHGF